MYTNDTVHAQFIGVIADTMKSKTAHELASAPFISFMIDGDTDMSMKECQIVYAQLIRMGKPVNILIGHIEVQHASAQKI